MAKKKEAHKEAQEAAKPASEPQTPPAPPAPASEPGNAESGEASPPAPSDGAPEGAGSNDAAQEGPNGKAKAELKVAKWETGVQAKVEAAKGPENLSNAEKRALIGSHPQGFSGLK